jgi:hypothetical protein
LETSPYVIFKKKRKERLFGYTDECQDPELPKLRGGGLIEVSREAAPCTVTGRS